MHSFTKNLTETASMHTTTFWSRVTRTIVLAVLVSVSGVSVWAAPIDLSAWTAESYGSVGGFPDGVWNVGGGGDFVVQQNNGQPTIFYSDFNAIDSDVTGTVQVLSGGDDDFFGFVLGFEPGDSTSASADYLLLDWKGGSQFFNFTGNAATNATPGSTAPAGLALSQVSGTPSADEIWGHVDFVENPGGGVDELGRGDTLGGTGWAVGTEYDFRFIFTSTNIEVYVDDVLQLDIDGTFSDGRLGFYNFSQHQVRYSAFEIEPAPAPAPATVLLFAAGIAGLGSSRRRS